MSVPPDVIDGFCALIERNVLWEAAAAGDNHVGLLGNVHLIDFIDERAARFPGLQVMPGENRV